MFSGRGRNHRGRTSSQLNLNLLKAAQNHAQDARATLKWGDLVAPDTPVPTPWNKEAFEAYSREIQKRRAQIRKDKRPESEMEALFREELAHEQAMFAKEKYAGRVGAFEGAIYEAKGYYRPEIDCIMFSRTNHFCAVCRRAIERIIDLYS